MDWKSVASCFKAHSALGAQDEQRDSEATSMNFWRADMCHSTQMGFDRLGIWSSCTLNTVGWGSVLQTCRKKSSLLQCLSILMYSDPLNRAFWSIKSIWIYCRFPFYSEPRLKDCSCSFHPCNGETVGLPFTSCYTSCWVTFVSCAFWVTTKASFSS